MEAVLHFDGACEPNPGIGSWAYIAFAPDGDTSEGSGVIEDATNNLAEWASLEYGLMAVAQHAHWLQGGLLIRGDSQLVIHQLTGKWACRAENLKPFLGRCRGLLDSLGCSWRAEWIPRERNRDVDGLTVAAWERATGRPFPHRKR